MMRLTCPNCAAQYEVPEDVIPAEGRDVQCSNCGQTWFQAAPGIAAAEEPAEVAAAAPMPQEAAPEPPLDSAEEQPEADTSLEPEAEAAAEAEPEDTADYSYDTAPAQEAAEPDSPEVEDAPAPAEEVAEEMPEDSGGTAPPRNRALDPALTDILREEAEREASLRAAESQGLETQPDLGLEEAAAAEDEAARRSRQARDRMARIRGEDPRQIAAAESGSRKELLPDIEEINSTLRSAGGAAPAPQTDPQDQAARRKSSFARGFSVSVIAALILVMVYDNAPLIAEKLPQADSMLTSYVGWVDQARLWLDGQVKSLTGVQ